MSESHTHRYRYRSRSRSPHHIYRSRRTPSSQSCRMNTRGSYGNDITAERLRKELENMKRKAAEEEAKRKKAEQELLKAENERLRAELEDMKQKKQKKQIPHPPKNKHWYIYDENKEKKKSGPYKDTMIIEMYNKHTINGQTLIYHHNVTEQNWLKLADVDYIHENVVEAEEMELMDRKLQDALNAMDTLSTAPCTENTATHPSPHTSISPKRSTILRDPSLSTTNLYVDTVPAKWTHLDLRKYFTELGATPSLARVMKPRGTSTTAYGFVEYFNACRAEQVLHFCQSMKGFPFGIKFAKTKKRSSRSNGGQLSAPKRRKLSTTRYKPQPKPKQCDELMKMKKKMKELVSIAMNGDEPNWDTVELEKDSFNVQRDVKLHKLRIMVRASFPLESDGHKVEAIGEWEGNIEIETAVKDFLNLNGEYALHPQTVCSASRRCSRSRLTIPKPVSAFISKMKFEAHPRIAALNGQWGVVANQDIPSNCVLGQYNGSELSTGSFNAIFGQSSDQWNHNLMSFDQTIPEAILSELPIENDLKVEHFVVDPLIGDWRSLLTFVNDCRRDIDRKEPNRDDCRYYNVEYVQVLVNGWPQTYLITKRDIKSGEELMSFYGSTFGDAIKEQIRNSNKKRAITKQIERLGVVSSDSDMIISSDDDAGVYTVDSIIGHREAGDKSEFYVKWKGFNQCKPTWEPSHVLNASIMNRYLEKKGLKCENNDIFPDFVPEDL
eukprot:480210_1